MELEKGLKNDITGLQEDAALHDVFQIWTMQQSKHLESSGRPLSISRLSQLASLVPMKKVWVFFKCMCGCFVNACVGSYVSCACTILLVMLAITSMCCASTVRFLCGGLCKMYIYLRAHEAGVILRDQYAPEAFLVQDATPTIPINRF